MSERLVWHGAEVKAKERAAAAHGLYLWAEEVLTQATKVVPLAPSGGTLQRSGKAFPPGPGELKAAVSYDTPYAVRQHEELDYHHAPGRTAKYLETPLNASKELGRVIVAREIKAALK